MKPRITLRESKDRINAILTDVAEKHGLTVEQLMRPCRKRRFSWPRHEAFDRIYRETRESLPTIAERFDMDHTSVLYGICAHRRRQAQGKVY
jgi:chromosomal replication initiation ATPase DnaA